jgi:hypothetical protein
MMKKVTVIVIFMLISLIRVTAQSPEEHRIVQKQRLRCLLAYEEKGYTGTVNDNHVRIRSIPSLKNSKILTTVNKGTKLKVYTYTKNKDTIDGLTSSWYRVSYTENEKDCGWIFGAYVSGVSEKNMYALENVVLKVIPDCSVTAVSLNNALLHDGGLTDVDSEHPGKKLIYTTGLIKKDPFYDETDLSGAWIVIEAKNVKTQNTVFYNLYTHDFPFRFDKDTPTYHLIDDNYVQRAPGGYIIHHNGSDSYPFFPENIETGTYLITTYIVFYDGTYCIGSTNKVFLNFR